MLVRSGVSTQPTTTLTVSVTPLRTSHTLSALKSSRQGEQKAVVSLLLHVENLLHEKCLVCDILKSIKIRQMKNLQYFLTVENKAAT